MARSPPEIQVDASTPDDATEIGRLQPGSAMPVLGSSAGFELNRVFLGHAEPVRAQRDLRSHSRSERRLPGSPASASFAPTACAYATMPAR